ncbi:serine hydrolase domain-containing protein [Streptosporangium sp. NPDC002721]|uniref:serine hydrolase domain-containing protein n=1 Tax=Streptosporangium sp. NPDC002721 TaxID=3366188 RepID=UPI0036B76C7F
MTKRRIRATTCTAIVLAGGMALGVGTADAGASPRHDLRSTLQHDADRLLKYGAPGVLVGLDRARGDITVRSGLGDTAKRTPVPWDAKFRVGSFTKTYVSATVLQLVGERRLSLDDTVHRWLPGLLTGNGNDGRTVTVRQLLQHTSPVPDYTGKLPMIMSQEVFERDRYKTLTERQLVRLAMTLPPRDLSKGQWEYSNTNYILLGMIISRVTGNTWQEEVRDRIIRPLRLRGTSIPKTSPAIPQPHAVGYERFPGEGASQEDPKYGEFLDVTRFNPSLAGAAGAMISTTDDANRFLRALLSGRVLKPAQLAEMKKTIPTSKAFQGFLPGARYGLGIMLIPNSCGGHWSHGGDIFGFMTRNGVNHDGSRSVVVSINTDSLKPDPGIPYPRKDVTLDLVDHALCGGR